MGWLRSWRTNRAAKDYARRLKPWLQRSFGHSDRYPDMNKPAAESAIPAFAGARAATATAEPMSSRQQGPQPARIGGDDVIKTVRREEPKVGRNEPCPCGSGKKYKKCHGAAA